MSSSILEWEDHPARRRPWVATLVVLFCTLLAVVASRALSREHAWTSGLFLVLLLGSVSSFLLPTRYRVDDEALTIRHLFTTRTRAWKDVRRIDVGSRAVLVATMRIASRLDRFRAIVVPLDEAPHGTRERFEFLARSIAV